MVTNSIPSRRTVGRLVGLLGWVTVFGGHSTSVSNQPPKTGQLSLLPSVGREMSTSRSVVMLCSWE